jgi:hypothetical protein
LAALSDVERGFRHAFSTLRERGGLEKPLLDGAEKVAERASASMSIDVMSDWRAARASLLQTGEA